MTTIEQTSYGTTFERIAKLPSAAWLADLRQTAMARFVELGLPTNRLEDWKYTSTAALAKIPFGASESASGVSPNEADALGLGVWTDCRQVFVDGHYVPGLSLAAALPAGVTIGSLADWIASAPDRFQSILVSEAATEKNAFRALNTALFEDGAYVEIARGVVVEKPIHVLYISTGSGAASMSTVRKLIVAKENSQVTIVEQYVSMAPRTGESSDSRDFVNALTGIHAAENATVKHYTLQRLPEQSFFVNNVQIDQQRFSNVTSLFVSLGAGWARTDASVLLDAEGAECTLDGLYMATRDQHVDFHTTILHAKPHCTSHELFKGIVNGHATAVFNGRVVVPPDAQKTDSIQGNHNLLLSDHATVNTKPQLEIYADDVKCAHGTTVGQLEEESVFYLRARGLDRKEARAMLTQAFAREIVERIAIDGLREKLDGLVLEWLPTSEKPGSEEEVA